MCRWVARLLVGLMIFGLAACWPFLGPLEPSSPVPPAAAPQATYVPPSVGPSSSPKDAVSQPPVRRRTANRPVHTAPPASVASVPPENSKANAAGADSRPSLTLDGEDDSKASTELVLHKVDQRLAIIDRTKLTPSDAATFDQANGFASSAHRALADHDYVVASGLAEKASTLTGLLNMSSQVR